MTRQRRKILLARRDETVHCIRHGLLTFVVSRHHLSTHHFSGELGGGFTPGGKVIYVGDTETKYAYFESEALSELGVELEKHGKMPDVIIHHTSKNWLLLIEAVTSHGPVDAKRKNELKKMFSKSSAGLVFVTTFLTRKAMIEYLHEISWETEVWVADSPTHMIHFNGERFLGPY